MWCIEIDNSSSIHSNYHRFHHMDMHFEKNLFTFWVFSYFLSEVRIEFAFLCQLLNVSVKYSLLIKQAYMRATQFCWLLLNWREKKKEELKSRRLPSLNGKIWAHETRRLYKCLLNAIVFIIEKLSFSLISFFELLDKICEPLELNTQNHWGSR